MQDAIGQIGAVNKQRNGTINDIDVIFGTGRGKAIANTLTEGVNQVIGTARQTKALTKKREKEWKLIYLETPNLSQKSQLNTIQIHD